MLAEQREVSDHSNRRDLYERQRRLRSLPSRTQRRFEISEYGVHQDRRKQDQTSGRLFWPVAFRERRQKRYSCVGQLCRFLLSSFDLRWKANKGRIKTETGEDHDNDQYKHHPTPPSTPSDAGENLPSFR